MGFCLFREAGTDNTYFAVNVAHVDDLQPQETPEFGCVIKFPFNVENFTPMAAGALELIQKLLMDASKIGLGKIDAQILTGSKVLRQTPLLINNPNRIALIRELRDEELANYETDAAAVSQLVFMDGTTRLLASRPGVFAAKVNANGKVPILNI